VNYEPNSFGGPSQTDQPLYAALETGGLSGAYAPVVRDVDDFAQAGDLYRLMSADEQQRLIEAIAGSLSQVQHTPIGDGIIERSIEHFRRADADYGKRLDTAVGTLRN
jgi:catalase